MRDSDLTAAFSKYGTAEARVVTERETGRSKGFGFVTFTSVAEATAAKDALHDTELNGRKIRVSFSSSSGGGGGAPRGDRAGGSYGGRGGGYGGGRGGEFWQLLRGQHLQGVEGTDAGEGCDSPHCHIVTSPAALMIPCCRLRRWQPR